MAPIPQPVAGDEPNGTVYHNGINHIGVHTNGSAPSKHVLQSDTNVNGTNGVHHDTHNSSLDQIAIVGMSCRVSGDVTSPDKLWELCSRSRGTWSEIPKTRFNSTAYYHPNPDRAGASNPTGAHFLTEDPALFDAPFFQITAEEAQSMDPQQRILLECTYEALESGGFPKNDMSNAKVGVFTGGSFADYELHNYRDIQNVPRFQATGCAQSLQSNRLSYYFNFKGPSMTVDTACSSSLTALHVAVQSLRSGESTHAVVSACHLNLLPEYFISMSSSRLFSDSGKSYPFDSRAVSGYGRGEGAGCVFLRPLADALAARDHIRAVIVNTGVNQDGRTQGITMPNGLAQETLMRNVYASAGIDPSEVGFVEAHGTGTKVGDPIEATAIHSVFGQNRSQSEPLYVGSVKSNIGHLEGASGIVALIKTAMMLERGFVLPNHGFKKVNPAIPLDQWNIKILKKQIPWPKGKRFASVNNFGFGGTNAHVILGKPPPREDDEIYRELIKASGKRVTNGTQSGPKKKVFPLSANDKDSLVSQVNSLVHYLEQRPDVFEANVIDDLAYTLGQRRTNLTWRTAFTAAIGFEAVEKLSSSDLEFQRSAHSVDLGFVFTGQGAQWYAMGRELFDAYPVFANTMAAADQCLKSFGAKFSLIEELMKDERSSVIGLAQYSQPVCTALQLALTDLLRSWDIRPKAVTGHSSGEIGAAYAAEILGLQESMAVAYYRGIAAASINQEHPEVKGSMMAVGSSADDIVQHLQDFEDTVVIACINSPTSITLSGDEEAINQLQKRLEHLGIFNRKLQVNIAYHSHHMQLVATKYLQLLGKVHPRHTTDITFHSSVYGRQLDPSELTASYWVKNLVSRVEFTQSLRDLLIIRPADSEEKINTLVEVGPHSALAGPIRDILKTLSTNGRVTYNPTLVRKKDAIDTMQMLAASLFARGLSPNFESVNFPLYGRRIPKVISNLPPYAWNHKNRFWIHNRIAQNQYFPPFARNDILGLMSTESNDLEPQWRNVIRADDLPWIRGHKVQGVNVWPLAGHVAIAVEAAAQKAQMQNYEFDSFVLKNVTVGKFLAIPDVMPVEIMITLKPYGKNTQATAESWSEFKISSFSNGRGWEENCNGIIKVQRSRPSNPVTDELQTRRASEEVEDQVSSIHRDCRTNIESVNLYEHLDAHGIQYGSEFRAISGIRVNEKQAVLDLIIPDTAAEMPSKFETPLHIHPSTLDLCFQMVWPLLGAGTRVGLPRLYLPSKFDKLTLTSKSFPMAGEEAQISGIQYPVASVNNSVSHDIYLTRKSDPSTILAQIEGFKMSPVPKSAESESGSALKEYGWNYHLKPCFEFSIAANFTTDVLTDETKIERIKSRQVEQAAYYFIQDAMKNVTEIPEHIHDQHQQKLIKWFRDVLDLENRDTSNLRNPEWLSLDGPQRESVKESAADISTAGQLVCRIGQHLPQIIRKEVDSLSILLENGLWDRYFADQDFFKRGYEQAAACIDRMANQNPHLNILEIGAGTGGATAFLLETLGGGSTSKDPRFSSYVFTDVSVGFLGKAKKKFGDYGDLISYKTLDISQSPKDQGYQENSYDVIVACNVLHATPKIDETVSNVRRLLKPGGKLILMEETTRKLRQIVYAVLPGWWLSEEEYRNDGPTLSLSSWDELLKRSEFTGVDLCLQDYPDTPEQTSSLMISTASVPQELSNKAIAVICNDKTDDLVLSTCKAIHDTTGTTPFVGNLDEVDVRGKFCIVTTELDNPHLSILDKELFSKLQELVRSSSGILWVVNGAYSSFTSPQSNMVVGLARAIRSETALPFCTLDLDSNNNTDRLRHILSVFETVFGSKSALNIGDMEFVVRDNEVFVPRITRDPHVNRLMNRALGESKPEPQPFGQRDRSLILAIENPGALDTMYFVDDGSFSREIPHDYIEIQVKFVGVNFRDVMQTMGQIEGQGIGVECSGIVTAVGSQVQDFIVGDNVCAVAWGTYSNLLRCRETSAHKVPNSLSLELAASIPVVFCTAYYSLIEIGRLTADETILIHAAAGGVGQAAIMVAQTIGAEIFVTVGSAEKKEFLKTTYGLDDAHILYSRDNLFAKAIQSATKGQGVDVVLNCLSGDQLRASWECVAPFGRFIELGKRDISQNARLDMLEFERNLTFASVDLMGVADKRPGLMRRLFSSVFKLLTDGKVKTVAPVTTFSISDLEVAFRTLSTGKGMGKMVIDADQNHLVKAMPRKAPTALFTSDATYVIIGGTGGLGRSIAVWLVNNGAKHIVLVSRSGGSSAHVRPMVTRLQERGAVVEVCQCDMTSEKDVKSQLGSTLSKMPPVRGAVYAAMVLRDILFEKMSFTDYIDVIKPKVDGVWNLHNVLADAGAPVEFMILLSSIAGIVGNRGQAAYAATATFMDAFAQYRNKLGLPCVSIDLCPVAGVGYLAENLDREKEVTNVFGNHAFTENELLELLGTIISEKDSCANQCLTGMTVEPGSTKQFWLSDPKFSHLVRNSVSTGNESNGGASAASTLSPGTAVKAAASADEAESITTTALLHKISNVLMKPLEDIDPKKPLAKYGMDSLTAIEIRNWIARDMQSNLQILEILTADSVIALARVILSKSKLLNEERKSGFMVKSNVKA